MRKFGTQGPVNAHDNYIVSRAQEMNELLTYGVITPGTAGLCEIANPIYQHGIL